MIGKPATVSGAEVVTLPGDAMVGLVRAVAALGRAHIGRHVVVGGVAVTVRLRQAHRATADVDAVVDETTPPDAIEALAALPDVERDRDSAHRLWIAGTKIEIQQVGHVTDADFEGLTDRQALYVAAHTWALETAIPATLIAAADDQVSATAPFATSAALIAMKLHAIQDRRPSGGMDKRAGDAWDLYRLLTDLDADASIRTALSAAPLPLRAAVREAAQAVLVDGATRTRSWLRSGDARMAAVTAEEIRFLAEPLVAALA